jgi:hypothetical protein
MEIDFIPGHLKSIYLVCNIHRLGGATFLTRLEYEHYAPDSERNDDFTVYHLFYNNIPYYIIEIPAKDFKLVPALAEECGLRPVPGKPQSIGDDAFNLKCPDFSCFTLESSQPAELDVLSAAYKAALKNEYASLGR